MHDFFLLFSSADKRTQFLTSLAGPGMLSLVKQASAKATAFENFSTDTTAGLPVEEPPRIALTLMTVLMSGIPHASGWIKKETSEHLSF